MMPIDMAISKLGYTEDPPNSNRTLFGKWFGMDGQPWCMFFVQWCYAMAGYTLPCRTGSCSQFLSWYQNNMPFKVLTSDAPTKPNDIVIYKFGHVGMVEKVSGSMASIHNVEGNTSPTNKGDQANGGMVCRKDRSRSLVNKIIRPFDFKEEIENMTKKEFIDGLTPQEAYTLLTKAMTHASSLKEPDWSKKEGHWTKAKSKGIIKGDPETLVKRAELAAILGRAKLL